MKKIVLYIFLGLLIFSCNTTKNNFTGEVIRNPKYKVTGDVAPFPGGGDNRSANLDYIFNPETLGVTTLTITRSEWNILLDYYDQNSRNESYIIGNYEYTKGDYTWNIDSVGIRLRGNTSRRRPQIDFGSGNDDYVPVHFKVDYEEWRGQDEDCKLAGCMNGVILKRFKDDPTYVREIYGYNLFRRNGIWTSPRACYTRLLVNIVDDSSAEKNAVETVNFGIYAMIEEINKQFLKERSEDLSINQDNCSGGLFSNNKGDLWKCTWQTRNGAALVPGKGIMGIEEIYLNESKSKRVDYDLKTNKENFSEVREKFTDWIDELNNLDESNPDEVKSWFLKNMDVDLFLKTYAVNVILGMWDDYWGNKNNYYLYFDTNGKMYFIPYDYDNILGVSSLGIDGGTQNPLNWGDLEKGSRPLMQKIFSVPEFVEIYKSYLVELSGPESHFYVTNSKERINRWQKMIKPYILGSKLSDSRDTSKYFIDEPASWGQTPFYKLLEGDETTNFFEAKTKAIGIYSSHD